MKTLILLFMMIGALTSGANSNFVSPKSLSFEANLMQKSTETDEFLDYWYNTFRLTPTCDVTYEEYLVMFAKYMALNEEDRQLVSEMKDEVEPQYTIGQIITTLFNKYNVSPSKDSSKETLNQGAMIGIVAGVAIFGVTTILIFYILKNKKIIK